MDKPKFSQIKQAYDMYYRSLLKSGKLPMRSTEKGFWNAAISDEIFRAFQHLNLQEVDSFIDLGSGDGKITLIASLFCENAEGVEIDGDLHEKANQIKDYFKIVNATFHNEDFLKHNISEHDIVFINPDSPFNRGLENKLLADLKGKLLVHGEHFHPKFLRKEKSFRINGTKFTLYSKFPRK